LSGHTSGLAAGFHDNTLYHPPHRDTWVGASWEEVAWWAIWRLFQRALARQTPGSLLCQAWESAVGGGHSGNCGFYS